jgi:hypothetical protein
MLAEMTPVQLLARREPFSASDLAGGGAELLRAPGGRLARGRQRLVGAHRARLAAGRIGLPLNYEGSNMEGPGYGHPQLGASTEVSSVATTVRSSITSEADRGTHTLFSGLGVQRRQAFRVRMRLPVHIEAPMCMYCETVDMSVLGVRLDRELPCAPGVEIRMTIEVPSYDGTKPREIELEGEVVRVQDGDTGVQFADMTTEQKRAVREIINEQQRLLLAARAAARQGLLRIDGDHCRLK